MPLDGEEHARAKRDKLERKQGNRNPVHHFEYFRVSA